MASTKPEWATPGTPVYRITDRGNVYPDTVEKAFKAYLTLPGADTRYRYTDGEAHWASSGVTISRFVRVVPRTDPETTARYEAQCLRRRAERVASLVAKAAARVASTPDEGLGQALAEFAALVQELGAQVNKP
jgi:Lon protease-like protein